ncbi:MAG TPA: ATP-binding protein [Mycobacteriales bacterium]|jgi:PAS domain S-box-containing protein|nr:ATP-binding protein [Mycobacteriales bacterium]
MAPAVPFALLGAVQLASVAVWLGFAAAAWVPLLRRRTTPIVVAGALVMALADALTVLRLASPTSDGLGELRIAGLALLAIGFAAGAVQPRAGVLPAIVVPLGAKPAIAIVGGVLGVIAAAAGWLRAQRAGAERAIAGWVSAALLATALATALAEPARNSSHGAVAVLIARGLAAAALAVALVYIARESVLGKLLGAIVAGVVVMAIGAVAVVGVGVAGEVQHEQSQRLLAVARAQQQVLQTLATRAGLFAQVVAQCPASRSRCVSFLNAFSDDPDYFAVIDKPGSGVVTVAPSRGALDPTALVQLAGSAVVRGALAPSATTQTATSGPLLLHGAPARLAIVAAVPGRPAGVTSAQVKPTFAAVYGIGLVSSYLKTLQTQTGYDVSIVAGDSVLSSSLGKAGRGQVLAAAVAGRVDAAGAASTRVDAARGQAPTVAFVPIAAAGNDNRRVATLAVSQSASDALAAQRSVLRRLVLTALAVLVVVALAAFATARRVVEPVRRLTLAAGRVRGGDLSATVEVGGRDEVGSLARAFDAMTSSLRGLTGDLRSAAAAEAALRARLEAVVGSMTDGLVTTDGDGLVAGANPMALHLLGCAESDILGKPLAAAVHIRGSDGDDVLAGDGSSRTAEAVLHRADGGVIPVRTSIAPLVDEAGQVVVFTDRTREREIERMKTEFLSNVSHELRTPLTPIRGYAEMLARRPNLPRAQVQEFVAEILAGTARMNRAVDLLVDVAALEAGRVVPTDEQIVLRSFLDERLALWRTRYPERRDDLRRRLAARLPAVEVDPVWLTKALDELVDNAVKYTDRGTKITLAGSPGSSVEGDGEVRLAVRDAGAGIDTDRLAELMGDFSQADGSQTRPVGGLGLGLGFVTRVAAQLGLRLTVVSSPGRGAEFALDLPVASAPRRTSSNPRR